MKYAKYLGMQAATPRQKEEEAWPARNTKALCINIRSRRVKKKDDNQRKDALIDMKKRQEVKNIMHKERLN